MAFGELTGYTTKEVGELREEYHNSPKYRKTETPFETAYCLTRIGKQPDEYTGPTRFCANRAAKTDDGEHAPSCNFHGATNNAGNANDNLKTLAGLTHGMYASEEHLEEVFTEQDQKLYDWVMSWADTYGWPSREEDPSRYDDLETIAINRVRIARSNKYILDEGELKREEIYDENGNLREIDNPHALSEDIRLKRKLVTDLKKELGLTPKEKSRMDAEETEASAAEQIAEVASSAVLGEGEDDSPDFDPDDERFEQE
jgi:hypothetical protein